MMRPIPPFIANSPDNMHCVNAVYRMLFKHFFNEDIDWAEIDALTKVIPGKGTWTVPGSIALAKRGIKITNIEPVGYDILYKEGVTHLTRVVGEQTAKYYLERTNIALVLSDIPEFLRVVHHETRKSTAEEIISHLQEGHLVGAEVNSSILNSKPGFDLHFVLMYDFDGVHIHFHDPGLPPVPSRKITLAQFNECFAYKGANCGVEIYYK